jgi:hypothetical protein
MRKNARKAPFKRVAYRRATRPAYRIHSDLREFPVRSKKGYKYSVCFVCDATRRGKAYISMRRKSDTLEVFKRFIAEECEPRGFTVKVLRSDNGGEYIDAEFALFCRSRHITREFSPFTATQSVCRRRERVLLEGGSAISASDPVGSAA